MAVQKKHKTLKIILIVIAALLVLSAGAFLIYASNYSHATQTLQEVMAGADTVQMTQDDNGLAFLPKDGNASIGIIFYPGGKVEYTAYAPLMRDLAEKGYACYLLKMPFNLAVFDVNAADKVIQSNPGIRDWWIGGHSLGGSMACSYASKNFDLLKGIILLASYTASDLGVSNLKALSLYGSEDLVLNRTVFETSKTKMPIKTEYVEIPGGNHGQFGDYGLQAGDGTATISRTEQQAFAVDEIVKFIGK